MLSADPVCHEAPHCAARGAPQDAPDGGPDHASRDALHDALQRAPHGFGFFEALRRLQQAEPALPRIGCSARPADDAVRLGQPPSPLFAASTLAAFERRDGRPPRLSTHAFGLFGPNGPLPGHVTEHAHERLHNAGDATFARFADLFHHRMLSLFFRAWATSQPAVDMDRPETSAYLAQIGSLIGIGRAPLRNRDAMPDAAKLHHAGALARRTRDAEGLRGMVSDLFGLPVAIIEFAGTWMNLPPGDTCRLGGAGRLGVDTLLGPRAWCAQHRFRLRLGPLDGDDYRRFLPGQPALERLQAVVRNHLGDTLAWELELVLKRPQVPVIRLGGAATAQPGAGEGAPPCRLGWSAWLGSRPRAGDAADLRLNAAT